MTFHSLVDNILFKRWRIYACGYTCEYKYANIVLYCIALYLYIYIALLAEHTISEALSMRETQREECMCAVHAWMYVLTHVCVNVCVRECMYCIDVCSYVCIVYYVGSFVVVGPEFWNRLPKHLLHKSLRVFLCPYSTSTWKSLFLSQCSVVRLLWVSL